MGAGMPSSTIAHGLKIRHEAIWTFIALFVVERYPGFFSGYRRAVQLSALSFLVEALS